MLYSFLGIATTLDTAFDMSLCSLKLQDRNSRPPGSFSTFLVMHLYLTLDQAFSTIKK